MGNMVRRLLLSLGLITAGLLAAAPASAIKGGRTADANKWQWAVALLYDGEFQCGGSLINRRWVLTAAHCATEHPSRITAVVGSHDRTAGTRIGVVRVYRHPNWQRRTHDIALLRLATPAPQNLGMVSVPDNAIHNRIAPAGTTLTAVGWGAVTPSSSTRPSALRQVDLSLKSASQCRSIFSTTYDTNAHLCTQTTGKGICVWDSGGPLVVNDGGVYHQIGISSFAESEDGRTLQCVESGFTRVASYTDWIDGILAMRPDAPVALTVVTGSAQVGLIWETPSGPFIESYEVRHRTADGTYGAWTAIAGSSASTTTHRVSGLTNGTTYAFQIRARNGAGPGARARVFGTPQAADTVPTFGSATVGDQVWIANVITTRTLPEAAGGDGVLTYHLTPSTPPAGMTFTASTRTLSGTPTTSAGKVAYTWTATDADGDDAVLAFGITVAPAFSARSSGAGCEFVSALSDTAMCSDVLPESQVLSLQLAELNEINLRSLPSDMFSGLTGLRWIFLNGNLLTSLPAGLFDGLGNLELLRLHGNTGSPFALNVVAERSGSRARAYLAHAAPRAVRVTWTATGGSTATGTAIIPAGQRYSQPFGAAAAQAVTITLSAPALDGVSESTSDGSGSYSGFQLAVPSASASVTIPGAPVDLSGLTISRGTLDPVFAADKTAYAASVGNAVTSVDVASTVSDPSMATLTVNGAAVTSGTARSVPLAVGENTISVVVAEQGGAATKTYMLTVTRAPSSVAELSGLTLSHGTLSPAFAAGETAYTAEVAHTVTSLTLTPTATDRDHATVTVSGVPVFSGDPSDGVDLRVGVNAVPIVVTAQDGTTTKAYTVTVTRLARPVVPPPPPDRQPSFGDVTVAAQRYMVGDGHHAADIAGGNGRGPAAALRADTGLARRAALRCADSRGRRDAVGSERGNILHADGDRYGRRHRHADVHHRSRVRLDADVRRRRGGSAAVSGRDTGRSAVACGDGRRRRVELSAGAGAAGRAEFRQRDAVRLRHAGRGAGDNDVQVDSDGRRRRCGKPHVHRHG